jgi:predicted ATPase/class 3 adenylate cyclase
MTEAIISFGEWVRLRRQALVLSSKELASRIGVAEVTIRKIEADERRPSPQVAALLAEHLQLASSERERFVQAARGVVAVDRLPPPIPSIAPVAAAPPLAPPLLPSGTVTFLLTDIEGSTRLWQQDPEGMQHALARHDAILGEAIEAHGGQRVKGTGDGLLAAFSRPAGAFKGALAAQGALQAESWQTSDALRVRMALHTGVAEERNGDYFGPALNRVARLLAAGHGGQILLSRSTQELVADQLPLEVALRDLGIHKLKDLERPEHIFQLVAPGLLSDFPPLRTTALGNLPSSLVELIGRDVEMDRLAALRQSARLLTLTGPGGTGKTQLALAVARTAQAQYTHGAWFIDLAPITDPALVAVATMRTLGIPEASTAAPNEQLAEWLRDKRLLLVLDNFEQVLSAAPLVSTILRTAPDVDVLVTSRVALRATGEHEVMVRPLALSSTGSADAAPPAVQLFAERAQAVQPDFALNNANLPAVIAICQRLDGLPLAIELAAARMKLFSLDALLARLDASGALPLLSRGRRDLPPRQQTIRAAIAWSYDLLSEAEQQFFTRLAIFADGWTLAACEHVCGEGLTLDVADGLANLIDHSLVKVTTGSDGEQRFTLLETVREFAHEQLVEGGDAEELRSRHAAYFLSFAERARAGFGGPDMGTMVAQMVIEYDNLRAALTWGLAVPHADYVVQLTMTLAGLWWIRGYWNEGWAYLERAIVVAQDVAPATRAELLRQAATFASARGDYERAAVLYEEALAIVRRLGDQQGIARVVSGQGDMAHAQGNYRRAVELLEVSLAHQRELGNQQDIANTLHALGDTVREQGDYPRAIALFAQSIALRQELATAEGGTRVHGRTGARLIAPYIGLGDVYLAQGTYDQARECYHNALTNAENVGDHNLAAFAIRGLGRVALREGDVEGAVALLEECVASFRTVVRTEGLAWTLHHLAEALAWRGQTGRAWTLLREALTLQQSLGNALFIAQSLEVAALLSRQQHARSAIRLLGAADAPRAHLGAPLPPGERNGYDHNLAAIRAQLDEATFTAAWKAGQALTLEEAVAEALALMTETGAEGDGYAAKP